MKKSVTLLEFVVAMILLTVVVLGAFAFNMASLSFFRSSNRKAEVVNEASFLLEHMHKHISQAIGHQGSGGITITDSVGADGICETVSLRIDNGTPHDFSDDTTAIYQLNAASNQLQFDPGTGTREILSSRVTDFQVNCASDDNEVEVIQLTVRYDPTQAMTSRENPEARFTDHPGNFPAIFTSSCHSKN